jgi:thiamine biosynthesis protein ThiI
MREKVTCLVSGGIDSPVACALMADRFAVLPLHFCLYPYTCEETFLVAMKVLKDLRDKIGFEKVIVFPWARILDAILRERRWRSYACLACRKSMFKIAESICEREGAVAIVTGESLGQKATQTLTNLAVTSRGIKFPILRPLLGLDKEEISEISRKLGLWHEVHAGCCFATPRYPRTRARPEVLEEFLADHKIEEAIQGGFEHILEVRNFEGGDLKDYLASLV